MTECNGCGRCCDPVVLPFTQNDVRALNPRDTPFFKAQQDPENRRWVLEDLTPIPRREGISEVADYMENGGKTAVGINGEVVVFFSHFFRCKWYNRETRQCEAYDKRPPICSGFPWYGDEPDSSKSIPPECSFRADIGEVPVLLIPKPAPKP